MQSYTLDKTHSQTDRHGRMRILDLTPGSYEPSSDNEANWRWCHELFTPCLRWQKKGERKLKVVNFTCWKYFGYFWQKFYWWSKKNISLAYQMKNNNKKLKVFFSSQVLSQPIRGDLLPIKYTECHLTYYLPLYHWKAVSVALWYLMLHWKGKDAKLIKLGFTWDQFHLLWYIKFQNECNKTGHVLLAQAQS